MITIHIEAADITDALCTISLMGHHIEASAEAAFVAWLKERGYKCELATDWETPRELAERLHISVSLISQALRRPKCPQPLDMSKGPTGRINYIRSTPALDAYLTRHLKPVLQP